MTDRVGYTSLLGTVNPATITITFASAVTNPSFHVAKLDSMQYDFTPTSGLGGLVLLSGNGGGGNGIAVSGNVILDANFLTLIGVPTTTPPPTTGPRSAYGSVMLSGSFATLTINVVNPSSGGDGGSFTLSAEAVPEPATVGMAGGVLLVLGILARRRT